MRRPAVLYLLLIGVLMFHLKAQEVQENQILRLRGDVFKRLEEDRYSEVAFIIDQNLKKAEATGAAELKAHVLNMQGFLYAKLDDFGQAENAWLRSMQLYDSLGMKKQYNGVYSNLVHNYVLFDKEEEYVKNLERLKTLVDGSSENMMYVYLSEVMMLYKKERYKKLLEKCRMVLSLIQSGKMDQFFARSNRHKLIKERALTTNKLYMAFALSELGTHAHERIALLMELYKTDLGDILRERALRNKSRVRKYLMEYYRDSSPNRDSLNFYLGSLQAANRELVHYLEEKSTKKGAFLATLLDSEKELKQTSAQLTLEANLIKERFLMVFLILFLLLGSIGFWAYKVQDVRFKTKASRKLAQKNRELKDIINKKLALEGMMEHVQDTITMDMYSSFEVRLERIRSSVAVLKGIKEGKKVENASFNSFFDSIEQGVLQVGIDINDLVWANNSKNNNLASVVEKLKDFANELEESNNGLKVNIISDYDGNHKLQRFWNRQILLIFKEAINNAFKYAGSDVTLVVAVKENELTITCADHGKGFDQEGLTRRSGVANMVKRANSINCTLDIWSAVGQGTKISFKGQLEEAIPKEYA